MVLSAWRHADSKSHLISSYPVKMLCPYVKWDDLIDEIWHFGSQDENFVHFLTTCLSRHPKGEIYKCSCVLVQSDHVQKVNEMN